MPKFFPRHGQFFIFTVFFFRRLFLLFKIELSAEYFDYSILIFYPWPKYFFRSSKEWDLVKISFFGRSSLNFLEEKSFMKIWLKLQKILKQFLLWNLFKIFERSSIQKFLRSLEDFQSKYFRDRWKIFILYLFEIYWRDWSLF